MSFLQKLKTVIISTALCAGIGYASSYWLNPKWKIEAEITHPRLSELGNYYSLFSMYHLIKGKDNAENKVPEWIYQNFTEQLVSYNNLKQFWENTPYYKQKIGESPTSNAELLNDLIKNTHFQPLNDNTGKITLILNESEGAQALLSSLLENNNTLTRKVMYDDLILQWKNLFTQVKTATELNLGYIPYGGAVERQDWQGKLNMMKSVSPLDEQFTAYHFTKTPQPPEATGRNSWHGIGAGIGLLLGLCRFLFLRKQKTIDLS
ncbi:MULTISPECIES: hypothetical protein [Rodentibacter]|uniref:Uncharacterized protein n=2 Tax=Rodentibacter TaxID=1960084 RepID=A0A1V3IPS3_9PAST|nr:MULTISPECIES: hypothetical protein [Rodentibacter]OOF37924.1 hypothetical protein BKK49_10795 [Rodentibacter rarus]OOF44121.1 hypothetical protein BKK50_03270 [Rodentibacter rarus]OOF47482.1 hypothetical protein BKK52_09160 [Rodentibacter trehalosifermentans]OOF53157.1 hypothetical protein BKK53_02370 [Rodentibacter trehalosifermentans]